jgi:hypothetical protein
MAARSALRSSLSTLTSSHNRARVDAGTREFADSSSRERLFAPSDATVSGTQEPLTVVS